MPISPLPASCFPHWLPAPVFLHLAKVTAILALSELGLARLVEGTTEGRSGRKSGTVQIRQPSSLFPTNTAAIVYRTGETTPYLPLNSRRPVLQPVTPSLHPASFCGGGQREGKRGRECCN